jgi:hypothetical protein
MEENQNINTYNQYPGEQEAQKNYRMQQLREGIYRFFYAIWPSVNRVLNFFFYHLMRIIRGFFKIAMEQFHQG